MSTAIHIPVGSLIEFSYPTSNRICVCTKLVRRRLLIQSIRDTDKQPIESWALRLRPDLRRGQYLLTGFDVDRKAKRSFYLSSARSIRALDATVKRLASYDPFGDGTPIKWYGLPWHESEVSEADIRDAMELFTQKTMNARRIIRSVGVFDYSPTMDLAINEDSGSRSQQT